MGKIKNTMLIIVFFGVCFFQDSQGQDIPNQIIMNPYVNPYTGIGQTLGGVSVALIDSIPDIFQNPANIAWAVKIKAFIGLNFGRNHISHSSSEYFHIDKQVNDKIYINSFAFSIPFRVLNVPFTLAASYNGNYSYHYDLQTVETLNSFSAQIYLASLGLGLQPTPELRVGIGATRLLSRYQQISTLIGADQCSSNATEYTTNIFYVGIQNKPNETLSLGAVFYFPAKIELEKNSSMMYLNDREYSSSLKLGLGYNLTDSWTFGLGYGYQWLHAQESGLSLLSAGLGYRFRWGDYPIPAYLSFETILFPQKLNEKLSDSGEDILKYQQIGAGIGIQFSGFSVYTAATWALYGDFFDTASLNSPLPPWS